MKKLYIILAALFAINIATAQPTIQWQKSLGGTNGDVAYSIHQTTDGGYIVAGLSNSNDGDVSGNHGSYDYWLVKLNSTGTIEWQKSLGGTRDDWGQSIQQTTDGGYIVAGSSESIDGDVTGHHGSINISDYWVVKLNSTGTIQWQKSLGGTYDDFAYSIQQTTDGGYIVAGNSYSNDGDVTGHHGSAGGYYDYWVVKLNSTGTIEWQKSLGGTFSDEANSIQQTTDGGYIVAGGSLSINGDVTGNHGGDDCWVVKLNSTGTIQWQKSLGGTNWDMAHSIQQTTEGGYIVAGYSKSNDGDVTGHHGTTTYADYWVVKLNSIGTIEWQKSLGGTSVDGAKSIWQTIDSGYIIAGRSSSNDEDVTGHHGTTNFDDYWVVKLNSTGTIAWQKSLGGIGYDEANSIQQTTDGGYIVAGESLSNDGDVTGNQGGRDYWVVKLSPVIGVKELSKNNNNLSVYPNPANKVITISNEQLTINNGQVTISNGQLTIINIKGQEVKKINASGNKFQIDINDLPGGLYFVKCWNEQGISIAKFVKE